MPTVVILPGEALERFGRRAVGSCLPSLRHDLFRTGRHCLDRYQVGGGARLGAYFGRLAAFGLLYGLLMFVEIGGLRAPSPWLTLSCAVPLPSSSAALLEFGRRLWNDFTGRRRLAALPLLNVTGLGVLGLASGAGLAGLEFGSRYLLCLPGAVLAAFGLAAHAVAMALEPDTRAIIDHSLCHRRPPSCGGHHRHPQAATAQAALA